MRTSLAKPFLIVLLVGVLVACFLVFRPFLTEMFIAAVLVSILYRPYQKLAGFLGGHKHLAALVMCVVALCLIILPLTQLLIYGAKQSVVAYEETIGFLDKNSAVIQDGVFAKLKLFGFNSGDIKSFVIDIINRSSNFMVSGAAMVVKGTTNFFMSLIMIIFTMFFFFADGEKMLRRLMKWSPLPNKYDERLFDKFRDVSYTTIVTTFVVVLAQGLVGAVGYAIIGLPAIIPGILIAIASLIPMIGATIVYIPTGIYLLLIGQIWQGIFILLWGFLLIGSIDNVIRTIMIKNKAHVNPIFVFFSILGGVSLFGFWGVVLGPLVISVAITVFHIYELEFKDELEPVEEIKTEKAEKLARAKK